MFICACPERGIRVLIRAEVAGLRGRHAADDFSCIIRTHIKNVMMLNLAGIETDGALSRQGSFP